MTNTCGSFFTLIVFTASCKEEQVLQWNLFWFVNVSSLEKLLMAKFNEYALSPGGISMDKSKKTHVLTSLSRMINILSH